MTAAQKVTPSSAIPGKWRSGMSFPRATPWRSG